MATNETGFGRASCYSPSEGGAISFTLLCGLQVQHGSGVVFGLLSGRLYVDQSRSSEALSDV